MADAEIDAFLEEILAAWAAGDNDKLMTMYTDDCSFASNVGDVKKDKANFRQDMAAFLGIYATCDSVKVDRCVCGDTAMDIGTFACKKKEGGQVDKGKYMAGYVKKDGKWLIRMSFNVFC